MRDFQVDLDAEYLLMQQMFVRVSVVDRGDSFKYEELKSSTGRKPYRSFTDKSSSQYASMTASLELVANGAAAPSKTAEYDEMPPVVVEEHDIDEIEESNEINNQIQLEMMATSPNELDYDQPVVNTVEFQLV